MEGFMKYAGLLVSVLMLSGSGFSEVETKDVIFQQGLDGYTGTTDAELRNPLQHYENGPDTNILKLSEHCSACVIGRVAIRFDLSSLPANAEIENATLELFPDFFDGGAMTGNYSVFQIAQPWNENEASWEKPSADLVWANEGGDFIDAAISKITVPRQTSYDWISFNVKSLVQTYVKKPAVNYGFLLINSLGAQGIYMVSSENENTEFRPKLSITYSVDPAAVQNTIRHPVTGRSVKVQSLAPHGLRLINTGTSVQQVTITRIDGASAGHIALVPDSRYTVTGLQPGIYVVSWGGKSLVNHSTVSLQR